MSAAGPIGAGAPLPGIGPARGAPRAKGQDPQQAAVAEAARQFEGLLISNLLKTAFESQGGSLFGNGPGSDVMDGMMETFLSEHITRAGGLGLAPVLERSLGQAGAAPAAPTGGDQ